MSKNLYPIHYLEVLKEIEKGEKSFLEFRERTKLDMNKLWRALTRLQLEGAITRLPHFNLKNLLFTLISTEKRMGSEKSPSKRPRPPKTIPELET
ncbi:MAG: hypothetical protein RXR17_08540 [Sulfolobaceae archaeon]